MIPRFNMLRVKMCVPPLCVCEFTAEGFFRRFHTGDLVIIVDN